MKSRLPQATESCSYSLPGWLITLLEASSIGFGKSKSRLVTTGVKNQIITELRPGRIYDLICRIYGIEIDLEKTETVSFNINSDLHRVLKQHAFDCGYSLNHMIIIALTKYLLKKDSPQRLWEELMDESDNPDNFFNTVIG